MRYDFHKASIQYQDHHRRLRRYVDSMPMQLTCQECGGAGGEIEPVLDDGSGPWIDCGYCEGIGRQTPWMRGWWLRDRKEMKKGT